MLDECLILELPQVLERCLRASASKFEIAFAIQYWIALLFVAKKKKVLPMRVKGVIKKKKVLHRKGFEPLHPKILEP
jgi:hypothetical protein